jgi:hypothetical protein
MGNTNFDPTLLKLTKVAHIKYAHKSTKSTYLQLQKSNPKAQTLTSNHTSYEIVQHER